MNDCCFYYYYYNETWFSKHIFSPFIRLSILLIFRVHLSLTGYQYSVCRHHQDLVDWFRSLVDAWLLKEMRQKWSHHLLPHHPQKLTGKNYFYDHCQGLRSLSLCRDVSGSKRPRDETTAEAEEIPMEVLPGTGRITSSGTVVQGHFTEFMRQLSVGDAIIITHPTT